MDKEQLISEMLLLPVTAIDYHISQHLHQLFPDKAFIESEGHFNVEGYAGTQQCTLIRKTFTYNQMHTYWRGPEAPVFHPYQHLASRLAAMAGIGGIDPFQPLTANTMDETQDRANKAWFEVQWQGNTLDVLILHIAGEGGFHNSHFWILAETADIARAFLASVSRWWADLH